MGRAIVSFAIYGSTLALVACPHTPAISAAHLDKSINKLVHAALPPSLANDRFTELLERHLGRSRVKRLVLPRAEALGEERG